MDDYPDSYITHNYPLIVLSGLGERLGDKGQDATHRLPHGDGATIQSDLPLVTGERADAFLYDLMAASGNLKSDAGKVDSNRAGLTGFQLEAVGRKYTLPPRKAAPPPTSPTMSPHNSQSINHPTSRALHSPLSPLSPASPIYPDGIMTPLWLEKHQYNVPAVFVSVVTFSSDPSRDSLNDNQLKNEINNAKNVLSRSGHRTRYAIILMSEKTILEAPEIEERLAIIRRATGLDPKTCLFFLPPNTSRVELSAFSTSILSTLQPVCVEYYRDLTKHARRKKGRGAVPPPTAPPTKGTSQTLSAQGWSARYDFKGGIFAEFRQEMEAAGRNYTQALETLLGSDGIFESTHSWSGRWDEARLLADALALRIIRCFLWNSQTTSAVQFWIKYRDSVRSVLDRRGKGTATYGWQVWMARWANVMAETTKASRVQSLSAPRSRPGVDANVTQEVMVFAPAEKLFPVGERLPPWHLLAHPGYWLWLSARHTTNRRKLAEEIPEEDRTPPGQSPATKVANRSQTYDYYLCPEPHLEFSVDHGAKVREVLNESSNEFVARGQHRFASRLELDRAKEFMRVKKYPQALEVLQPVWQSMAWRAEGWWRLAFEVIWALYECAIASKNVILTVAASWELLCSVFPSKRSHTYDLARCVDTIQSGADGTQENPVVSLQGENVCSFVSVSFNFANAEGHVGEPALTQCIISSSAHKHSSPVTLSSITIQFEGSLEQMRINHHGLSASSSRGNSEESHVQHVTLTSEIQRNSAHILSGSADLTLLPEQIIILECPIVYREAANVRAVRATVSIDASVFGLNYSTPIVSGESSEDWYIESGNGVTKRHLPLDDPTAITIFPKPPKMEIAFPSISSQYYIGEAILMEIELINNEEEEANVEAKLVILDALGQELSCDLVLSSVAIKATEQASDGVVESEKVVQIGQMNPLQRQTFAVSFTAPTEPTSLSVQIASTYFLTSDPETPVSKNFSASLEVSNPLEADYQVSTHIHPEPWPDFFSLEKSIEQVSSDTSSLPPELDSGIARAWLISARVTSSASDDLVMNDVALYCTKTYNPALYTIMARKQSHSSRLVPAQQHTYEFELVVRTVDPEERHPATLDLGLDVIWRRAEPDNGVGIVADHEASSNSKTTKMPVTTSLLLSPFIITTPEPRVVCTASRFGDAPKDHPVILLSYTIENPTMHFLTFSMAMDASEDFAFSGSKSTNLNLVPLSRHTVQYQIMPVTMKEDGLQYTALRPDLKITDVYFGQALKVVPGEGVSMDKEGIFVDFSGSADA
ncbi:hypothetical protein EV356DRAFT_526064 [Viridothelium virens]|uniref:Trafficking protein particle complex subunit 11 domain-containing protein n=1 Tax=Viridothelium virens TaxID=1048519 RepID=A0A6A6HL74_VIRVR|nr:hypothetical protein EV356DRAFT_526064 [Viridothelium virens]